MAVGDKFELEHLPDEYSVVNVETLPDDEVDGTRAALRLRSRSGADVVITAYNGYTASKAIERLLTAPESTQDQVNLALSGSPETRRAVYVPADGIDMMAHLGWAVSEYDVLEVAFLDISRADIDALIHEIRLVRPPDVHIDCPPDLSC